MIDQHRFASSFERFSSRTAHTVLIVAVLLAAGGVAITLSPLKSGFADAPSRGPGDVQLFRGMVDRIHAGEGFYQASAHEMTSRGYPTRSVFNWRSPLPIWLIGSLPDPVFGKVLLCGLALLLFVLAFGLLEREARLAPAVLGMLFMSGALLPCLLSDLFVMPELWAGVLICLSAVAYGSGRPVLGWTAGIAAIFVRELAAPYVIVCLVIAFRNRDWTDLKRWLGGLGAYAAFYSIHLAQIAAWADPAGRAHASGWIQFGGAGFVISVAQMNAYLLLLPQWITALYLALALVGLAGWNSPAGERIGLTICLFFIAFAVVGHDFNQYWGCLVTPLLCLPAARGPWALLELWKAAGWSTDIPRAGFPAG